MAEIESLEIKIQAQATKANNALDKLVGKLDRLNASLKKVNAGQLNNIAKSIDTFARAANQLRNVDTSGINSIARNLDKIGKIDSSALNRTASAVKTLSVSVNSGVSASAIASLSALTQTLPRFGYKNMDKAIANMPKISAELRKMIAEINSMPAVSQSTVKLITAISKLSGKTTRLKADMGGAANATKKTATEASKATVIFSGMRNSLSKISLTTGKIGSAFAGMIRPMSKVQEQSKSLAYYFGKLYASYFLVIRGIKALGRSIQSSFDYVETYNYWSVALGKIAKDWSNQFQLYGEDSAESYANSFSARLKELNQKMTGYSVGKMGELTSTGSIGLGLDPNQLMNFQARLMSVTNSMGLVGETSINTSKALSMLSADLSSLTNTDLDSVMNNLASGLIGQSRALYKYGIDITNATLQEYALANGIEKKVSAMTQGEKAQLRMIAILDQSKVAWGDQANTINSVANMYRVFKQQVANLARILGSIFLPIVQKILPVVNGLIISIQRLFSFMGMKIWGSDWQAGIMDGISGGAGTDDLDAMEDAADGVADGLSDSTDNAKKLKKALSVLPFDELNKLNDNSKDASSSSTSGAGTDTGAVDLSGAIASALADYEKVWNDAFKNSTNAAQGFADTVSNAFKKIYDLAEPTRQAIADLYNNGFQLFKDFSFGTLSDFYNNFLVPLGSWLLADSSGLPRFFYITNALLNEIDWTTLQASLSALYSSLVPIGQFAWDSAMDFYEFFLKPVAVWVMGEGIPELVGAITDFNNSIDWERLNKALEDFWKALAPFSQNVGKGFVKFYKDLFALGTKFINDDVVNGIGKLSEKIRNFPEEKAQAIGYALGILVTALAGLKILSVISPLFTPLVKAVKLLAAGLQLVLPPLIGLVETIGIFPLAEIAILAGVIYDLWKNSELFRETVKEVADKLKNHLGQAIEKIKPALEKFATAFSKLYEVLRPVVELIATLLLNLAGGVLAGLIDGLASAISGLLNFISGGMEILTGFIEIITGLVTLDFDKVKQGFKDIAKGAIDALSGAKEFLGFGVDIVKGLLGGIIDAVKGIGTWIKTHLVDPFVDNFKKLFGIHSPSTVMAEQGDFIVQGLLKGLKDKIGDVLDWFKDLPGKIKDKLGDAKEWLKEKGSAAMEGLKEKMADVSENKVKPFLNKVGENVKSWTGNAKDWLKQKGSDAVSSMNDAMQTARDSKLYQLASNLGRNIKDKVGNTSDLLSDKGRYAMASMLNSIVAVRDGDLSKTASGLGGVIKDKIGNLDNLLHSVGQAVMNGLKHGINDSMSALAGVVGMIPDRIRSSIGNLYNIGYNAIQAFRNGFTSLHIPLPHLQVGWDNWNVGNVSFSVPRFGINWYAKGGILDGAQIFGRMGNSLLGGGEAGKEAVLPLERNTGWMDTIADRVASRIDAGNGNDIYEQVYDAMMDANQQQNAILREMLNVDKRILAKDTTVEVTTSSINKAQERTNRRHGKVIVPVTV